eukprot:gene13944-14059_t
MTFGSTAPVEALVLPPVSARLPWSTCVLSLCADGSVGLSCLAGGVTQRVFRGWPFGLPAQVAWSTSRGLLAAGGSDSGALALSTRGEVPEAVPSCQLLLNELQQYLQDPSPDATAATAVASVPPQGPCLSQEALLSGQGLRDSLAGHHATRQSKIVLLGIKRRQWLSAVHV